MALRRVENNLRSLESPQRSHKQYARSRVCRPVPIGGKEFGIYPGWNNFTWQTVVRLQTSLDHGRIAEQKIATQYGLLGKVDRVRRNRLIPPVGLRFDCTHDHATFTPKRPQLQIPSTSR